MYKALDEIASLQYDWNGYGADPFSNSLIVKCKNILNNIIIQPRIFPTARNSIQFEYELEDDSYLEFEIFEEKITHLQIPKRDYNKAISDTINADEINKIIKEFYDNANNS